MDTEKCRVLLTVLHERSLSAAAEALGYTPSGISRLVDSLERETGFPLLYPNFMQFKPVYSSVFF